MGPTVGVFLTFVRVKFFFRTYNPLFIPRLLLGLV